MQSKSKQDAKPRKKTKRCKHCKNPAVARGLCTTCNAQARASILTGEITEEDAIASGLIDAPKRKGRPPKSGFARALKSLKPQ